MPANSSGQPPSYPRAQIKLDSRTDSKIIGVNLYGQRAEVSRIYRLKLPPGLTDVTITGLPSDLDERSLRIDGRGNATIQNVTTLLESARSRPTPTSPKLEELLKKEEALNRELARFGSALYGLGVYIESLNLNVVDADGLMPTIDSYHSAFEKYDEKKAKAQEELKRVKEEITKERSSLNEQEKSWLGCCMTVTISMFTSSGDKVEILVVYAVSDAGWTPSYEVRVNTETKESPVELLYKAAIWQDSGEDWKDVPITLATSTPTIGLELPKLAAWTVSSTDRNKQLFPNEGVNVSFKVPGVTTITADGRQHYVTIVRLVPEAKLSWFAVPCVSEKVHITATIKNSSEYTLLRGSTNVYVDGSYAAKSQLPLVSPQESFTCPLGVDPAIRVTYHPLIKQASESGLISKISSTTFSQRITVYNSKPISVKNLKVLDHIPVSQDAQIGVKLITPALTLPSQNQIGSSYGVTTGSGLTSPVLGSDSSSARKHAAKVATPVKVASGITAQWEGANDVDGSGWHLGRDGQIAWMFSGLASQQKVDLSLAWEVSAPSQVVVYGL
ncbi:hypothetical protein MD484_g6639, partial [Candolleomyces efflorescens]